MKVYPSVNLDNENSPTKIIGGFFGQIWNILQNLIEFETKYLVPKDKGWGVPLKNGEWNGMLGQLSRSEADFAISDFSMMVSRMDIVQFSTPLKLTRLGFFIRKSNSDEILWTGFLDPFHKNVWFSILFILLLIPNFAYILKYKNRYKNFYSCFLEILQIFCGQGMNIESLPKSPIGYIFYVYLFYISICLSISYSAALISSLTVQNFKQPFDDFQSFKQSSYKLIVLKTSSKFSFFAENSNALIHSIYKEKMDMDHLAVTHNAGLRSLCFGKKSFAFYASFYPIDYIKYDKQFCPIESIPMNLFESLSIVGQKNSPYFSLINYK